MSSAFLPALPAPRRCPRPCPSSSPLGPAHLMDPSAAAIDHARAGRSVVVATGTASGKSLCYQLPIAEAVGDRIRQGSALVIGPTKALAQDQLRALLAFDFPGLVAATYDGDSTSEERVVRSRANVVFTNPEMLHSGLLPNHQRWATFLGRRVIVVVDELQRAAGSVRHARRAHLAPPAARVRDLRRGVRSSSFLRPPSVTPRSWLRISVDCPSWPSRRRFTAWGRARSRWSIPRCSTSTTVCVRRRIPRRPRCRPS